MHFLGKNVDVQNKKLYKFIFKEPVRKRIGSAQLQTASRNF